MNINITITSSTIIITHFYMIYVMTNECMVLLCYNRLQSCSIMLTYIFCSVFLSVIPQILKINVVHFEYSYPDIYTTLCLNTTYKWSVPKHNCMITNDHIISLCTAVYNDQCKKWSWTGCKCKTKLCIKMPTRFTH